MAAAAGVFAYFVIATGLGIFEGDGNLVTARVGYTVALTLLMQDVLEAEIYELSLKPTPRNPHFWMSALNLGSFWAILVILMCWDPITDELYVLLVFAIGGTFFGASMTFWSLRALRGTKVWVNDNFDRSKWLSRGGSFKVVHFSRTPVLLLLFYLMMAGAPKGSLDEAYLMFMMVSWPCLVPLHPPVMGGFRLFGVERVPWSRLFGMIVLLGTLYGARIGFGPFA